MGLFIRAYFCFGKDLSFDSLDFIFYIQSQDPNSLHWSNYPPLFFFLGKMVNVVWTDSVLALQVLVFSIHAIGFVVLAHFFRKLPLFALVLLTLYPASLYAGTQIAPAALVECLSILLFVLLQKSEIRRQDWVAISILVLLLFATTYTAVIYAAFLAFTRSSRIKGVRARTLLLLGLTAAGIWTYFQVGWKTISWLNTDSIGASAVASSELFYAFAGYSWISLGLLIAGLIHRRRIGMERELTLLGTMFLVVISLNVLLSKTANEPRYFIFWTPWILLFFLRAVEKLKPQLKVGFMLLMTFLVLKGGLWFLVYPRSGLQEVKDLLQVDKPTQVNSINLSPRARRDFRTYETTDSTTCRRAYIWRLKDRSNLEIEKNVQSEGGVLIKDVTTRQPAVDPLKYQLWAGNCS